jgi:carbon-monoxide dehydrogenase medium subunit
MKPAAFVHHAPSSVPEAVATLREAGPEAKVLAGGQSLIPAMNMRLAGPTHLVDINGLPGADFVEVTDAWVRIGPLVRHEELRRSEEAYAALPLLRQALDHVAHPAIRNRGTTVGSIVHADPAGEMPAVLVLCDGVVEATGPGGSREVPAAEFFRGPLETVLEHDEIATAVRFRRFEQGTRSTYLEYARRRGDYALAGVALATGPTATRAAFVSVTDVPTVLDLTGQVAAGDLDAAAAAVHDHVRPADDIHASADYRRMLVAELARRGLESLTSGAHA